MKPGIALEAGAKTSQIGKAQLPRDGQHLHLVALDLIQANLMNLFGGQVSGGGVADEELIVFRAVGQPVHARLGAPSRNISDLQEARKAQIGGQNFLGDGG